MKLVNLVIPRGWWRDLRLPTGPAVRFAICRTCQLRHLLVAPDIDAHMEEFARRHIGHALDIVKIRNPDLYLELMAMSPNADIKQAFQGAQTMTVTNLHSLARSVTAGWQSDAVTYTSTLYLDDLFQVSIAQVNTAPANGKAYYVLAGHSVDGGTTYTRPFSGTQGTATYDAIDTLPQIAALLGLVPYATQNTTLQSLAMSLAVTSGGVLPERAAVGIVNDTGFTFAASGNTVKHNGVFRTVI